MFYHIVFANKFYSFSALGNVCSPEMSCDLINEIIKKFSSYTCNFVKKKVCIREKIIITYNFEIFLGASSNDSNSNRIAVHIFKNYRVI